MNPNAAVKQIPVPITAIAPPFSLTLDDPAIRREIENIRSLKRVSLRANVDAAISMGEALDRIKSQLKRGLWSKLLREDLRCGAGTARRYIQLYRFEKANASIVRQFKHLGTRKLTYLAALTPEIREKVIDSGTHRGNGTPTRSLEEMNPAEFVTYLRGLDPKLRTRAPRLQHLIRVSIQAAERLASCLSALTGRNIESSPLYSELEQAMLQVLKIARG